MFETLHSRLASSFRLPSRQWMSVAAFDLQKLGVVFDDVEQDAVNIGAELFVDLLLLHQGLFQLKQGRDRD